MTSPLNPPEPGTPRPSRLRGRLLAVGATGVVIGAAALGFAGIASAAGPVDEAPAVEAEASKGFTSRIVRTGDAVDGSMLVNAEVVQIADGDLPDGDRPDGELIEFELSAEDEAVFEEFEQCLTDGGFDEDAFNGDEADLTEEQFDAIDAVFDDCEPILDGLSEEAHLVDGDVDGEAFGFELSAEDESVFEAYDDCLIAGGIDEDAFNGDEADLTEEQFEAMEAIFIECEPILDGLSDDVEWMIADCEELEDGHVVEGHTVEGHEVDDA